MKKQVIFSRTAAFLIIFNLANFSISRAMYNGNDLDGPQTLLPESRRCGSPYEIERELTFLAREIPEEILGVTPTVMFDVYIPEEGHAELRVRQRGNKYEITKKIPVWDGDRSTKVMKEMTIPLTEREFQALSSSGKRVIRKCRYNVSIDGFPAEVDVFQGELEGLVMIDFEFHNAQERMRFRKPVICLADVTHEVFKAGGVLAGKSYADIVKDLERFGYKPLYLPKIL